MKRSFLWLFVFITGTVFAGQPAPDVLIPKIVDRLKENSQADDNYGYNTRVVTQHLNENGQVKSQEIRTYKTVWLLNRPYSQLLQVNHKAPNQQQQSDERRRRSQFIRTVSKRMEGESGVQQELKKIRWWEIYRGYRFTTLAPEPAAPYVFSFHPLSNYNAPIRSRFEKLLRNMSGTVWVDSEYNLVRVKGRLNSPVRFGWIFAKVDRLDVEYSQQKFGRVYLPATLDTTFSANVALFKTVRQRIKVVWQEPFIRPGYEFYATARSAVAETAPQK